MHSEVQRKLMVVVVFHVWALLFFRILSLNFLLLCRLLIGPPEDSFVYVGKMDDQD